MPSEGVKKVVARLLTDQTYREHFNSSPEALLYTEDLTDQEREALAKLDLSKADNVHISLAKELNTQAIRVGALYLSD